MDAVEKVYRFYESWRGEKFVYGKSACGAPLVGFFVGQREYPVLLFQYAMHAREWITALLALDGLFFHHLFGTDVLSETERAAVLERIERIVRASAREGAEVTECADGCDGSDAEKSETGK